MKMQAGAPSSEMPRGGVEISVVIPTYNRRAILAVTLPTVVNQDFPAETWEVIVVIDGSTDGTAELLRNEQFPRIRVLEQPNRGLAAARNAGLKAARGRLVLLLDDDMQCKPGLFRQHVQAHSAQERLIVEGAIELSTDSSEGPLTLWRHQMVSRHFADIRSRKDERWPWQAIRFANTSAPRSLLLESGGFDERFRFAHEDLEFGLRLSRSGARYRYVPEIAVRHLYRKDVRQVMDGDAPWYGRSYLLLSRLHPGYRKYSPLGKLRGGPRWKEFVRELTARSHLSPNLLLGPSFAFAARFSGNRVMRRAASRILDYGQETGMLRGAVAAAGSWQALRREFGMRLPVLMYHHVGPRRPGANPALTVAPGNFARQMNWLSRRNYTPIRVSDWIAWRSEGKPLPERPVLITFDDGYADLAEYAVPILHRYGFPAVVFVVTSLIGNTNEWDQKAGWGSLALMSTEQMRQAARCEIEFGAHSRTHPDMTRISAEQLRDETCGSADDLTELFGTPPSAFAYPFGLYNEGVREMVSRVFRVSFTTNRGMNCLATDPFLMNRLGVLPADRALGFGWVMKIGFDPVGQLRHRIRLGTRLRNARRRLFASPELSH